MLFIVKWYKVWHEWYLSPWSSMNEFIVRVSLTNKELDKRILIISGKWEFSVLL